MIHKSSKTLRTVLCGFLRQKQPGFGMNFKEPVVNPPEWDKHMILNYYYHPRKESIKQP
jgi:hypothetical protein